MSMSFCFCVISTSYFCVISTLLCLCAMSMSLCRIHVIVFLCHIHVLFQALSDLSCVQVIMFLSSFRPCLHLTSDWSSTCVRRSTRPRCSTRHPVPSSSPSCCHSSNSCLLTSHPTWNSSTSKSFLPPVLLPPLSLPPFIPAHQLSV